MSTDIPVSKPLSGEALAQGAEPATLLFVDDEANILRALRRVFRRHGYRILTAEGGAQGLEVLASEHVDLVISDMRMPGMDGAEFLARVAEQWPDTMRMLLTGYADLSSAVAAINNGKIFRYLSKPWEDEDLLLNVRHALERQALEAERRRLTELTRAQNEELKDLNANLEQKVQARTKELRVTLSKLKEAHDELKDGYVTAIKVFSSLIDMRRERGRTNHRELAERAFTLAKKMGLGDADAQDVLFAAMLKDVGKIGFSDELIRRPLTRLSPEEMDRVRRFPIDGQAALMSLEPLEGAAKLIRSHREKMNGTGFPDNLMGPDIPMGARVLAVVSDFYALQNAEIERNNLSPEAAFQYLSKNRGSFYDPQVVDTFVGLYGLGTSTDEVGREPDIRLTPDALKPGMVLSRNLLSEGGMVWLSKGQVLDERLVERIQDVLGFDRTFVYVRYTKVP